MTDRELLEAVYAQQCRILAALIPESQFPLERPPTPPPIPYRLVRYVHTPARGFQLLPDDTQPGGQAHD